MKNHKPYLNPELKLSDLIEPLQRNRTYISKFVNKVYGMNFNSYLNLCRLREMDRLRLLVSNKGRSLSDLAVEVGFGNYANYIRTKKQLSGKLNKDEHKIEDK